MPSRPAKVHRVSKRPDMTKAAEHTQAHAQYSPSSHHSSIRQVVFLISYYRERNQTEEVKSCVQVR